MPLLRYQTTATVCYQQRQKSKMSVLNAVKNKLLARVVACVNNQREYVKKTA